MTYGVRWDQYRAEECQRQAEQRNVSLTGYLYRFEDHTYSQMRDAYDGDEEYVSVGPFLELDAHPIRSVTPKGWTIYASNSLGWRFISRETQKRYALPTIREALESYVARKKRQAEIYEHRATKARDAQHLGFVALSLLPQS